MPYIFPRYHAIVLAKSHPPMAMLDYLRRTPYLSVTLFIFPSEDHNITISHFILEKDWAATHANMREDFVVDKALFFQDLGFSLCFILEGFERRILVVIFLHFISWISTSSDSWNRLEKL